MYRQGDVLLIPVGAARGRANAIAATGGRVVLALGEATGHSHVAEAPGIALWEEGVERYLRVPEAGAVLRHEEHAAIPLPRGDYRVVIQREFDPEEDEEWRNVAD